MPQARQEEQSSQVSNLRQVLYYQVLKGPLASLYQVLKGSQASVHLGPASSPRIPPS